MSFDTLVQKCSTPQNYQALENYYAGRVNLDALGVSLPPKVRVLELSAMWPKLAVDVLVESLVLEGFQTSQGQPPEDLRRILQVNNFDTLWPLAMTEALVQRRSYLVVGPGKVPGLPKVSAHPAKGIAVRRDFMGQIVEAVRTYRADGTDFAAHYQPGATDYYKKANGRWQRVDGWATGVDRVPIVEVVNRTRLDDDGHSEIEDIAGLCDAASRSLTNLQVAQELLAMPIRYLFGDGADELTKDADGNRISDIEMYFGHFLVGPKESTAGQIPGADLNQIIGAFKLYAQQVSAMTGIPPFMMGISADSNPSSAEAMRSAKDRLITRATMKQNLFGDPVEDLARLVLEMAGLPTEGLETLEARWRDPAVASVSARNASMLQAQSQGVISNETARDFLGLSPEQLARENLLDVNRRAATGG